MSKKLKPCPFCGNNVMAYDYPGFKHNGKRVASVWSVFCKECGCQPYPDGNYTKDEAIKAWNKRA